MTNIGNQVHIGTYNRLNLLALLVGSGGGNTHTSYFEYEGFGHLLGLHTLVIATIHLIKAIARHY